MKLSGACLATVVLLSAGCGNRGPELPPGTITVSIRLHERFNMQLITGLRIVIDSLPDPALRLQATDGGESHEVGGVAFTTQVTNVDGDAELEWLVEFPRSPFIARSFDFQLFPSLEESVPFSVGVDLLGTNGSIATASTAQDAGGGPIRFRRGTPGRVAFTIDCREGYTCVSANGAPAFDTVDVPERDVTAGELVTFSISATDPEGDRLVYSAQMGRRGEASGSLLLYGAFFDPGTRIFTWTPSEAHALGIDPTPYVVEFTATDPTGRFAKLPVVLRVSTANRAPVFGDVRGQVVFEGEMLEFIVPVTDPEDDPLTLAMTLSAPGGTLDVTSSASFDPVTRHFEWQTREGEGNALAYRATFTASDGRHRPVELRVDIHVVDLPPLSNGSSCGQDSECRSGHCVDSVCCKSACEAGWECAEPGWVCKKKRGQPCSPSSDPPECATGFCVNETCCASSFCISGYTCKNDAGECKKDLGQACGFGGECASGHCVTGACCAACLGPPDFTCASPPGKCRKVKGVACGEAENECADGLSCSDRVCCAAPSCPRCYGCNTPGRKGDCTPFEEEDPRGECGGDSASLECKQVCRAGACVWPGAERSCNDQNPCTTQDACAGDGRCAGNAWTVENPVPSAHFSDLVVLPSGHLLVASRGGPVYRYGGTSWAFEETRTAMPMRAFSALSNDDLFAVGERVILRRQAAGWTATPVNADLRGVWAGAPTLAFAVGQEPGGGLAVIWEWDGTRWSWDRLGEGELHAVAGHLEPATGRFLVVAVGLARDLVGTSSPWVLVNDGATTCGGSFWCRHLVPLPSGLVPEPVALRSVAVWGLSVAAAVGDRGLFAEYTAGLGWRTKCFDASGVPVLCPDEPTLTPGLTAIARSADGYLYVTRANQILRGKDGVWLDPYVVPGETRVDRIAPLGVNQFYAASSTGGLVAQGLQQPSTGTQLALRAVWAAPNGAVYAGGNDDGAESPAAFVKRREGAWNAAGVSPDPPSGTITSLHGQDETHLFASTQRGKVMMFDGANWICPEQQESTVPLVSVWLSPAAAGSKPIAGSTIRHFRRPEQYPEPAPTYTCPVPPPVWENELVPALSIWGPPPVTSAPRY
jgi:hypothetical protein